MTDRLLRITDIIGNRRKEVSGVLPIGRTCWYEGVKAGRFPQPVFLPGVSTPFWRASDIEKLVGGDQ